MSPDAPAAKDARRETLWRWLVFSVVVACALVPIDLVISNTTRASHSILGRDQGIFQYVAWAVRHGSRDYGDVRDVNGPLIHFVHIAFQWLGGEREVVFRRLELAVSFASFFLAGAALPAIVAHGDAGTKRPPLVHRFAWGVAGATLLGAQYLRYLYWDLAQRESFCDWFVLASLFFCAEALAPWSRGRLRDGLAFVAGLCAGIPVFGKHTYALYAVSLLFTVLVGLPREASPWRLVRRFAPFVLGLATAPFLALAYLLVYGDVAAFLRIYLVDAPRVYTFIWPHGAREIVTMPWAARWPLYTAIATAVFVVAISLRWLPRRAIFAASIAPLGLLGVVLQKKGFPYHFHPVSLGVVFGALVLVAALAHRRSVLHGLAFVVCAGVGGYVARTELTHSWFSITPWLATEGASEDSRASPAFEQRFRMHDFFPDELHLAADFLVKNTAEVDRVQTYGMDPYVLFLARRKSATPYLYAYDLNVDAALGGAEVTLTGPALLRARETIFAFAKDHGTDMMTRITDSPPTAFVLIDGSPLMTFSDAMADLEAHQPRVAAFIKNGYQNNHITPHVHVYLRNR